MKLFIWLYRWFFLDKVEWETGSAKAPPESDYESKVLLYKRELNILLASLRRQLPGRVTLHFLSDGKATVEEDGVVVATIAIFPKGDGWRVRTYVVVDLKPEHIAQKAWFQFAFIGFKVRWRKPTLYPVGVKASVPRGP